MQGLLNMLRALLRLTWRLAIVYVVFLILAWVLLGIHPREGASTTYNRIASIGHWITGFAGDVKEAGSGLAEMGEKHLKGSITKICLSSLPEQGRLDLYFLCVMCKKILAK